MNKIDELTKEYLEKDLGDFRIGDTVKVYYRIKVKEGDKTRIQTYEADIDMIEDEKGRLRVETRIQTYEGIVIAFKNQGVSKTFTVRKISYGVGVERIFPYYSPNVEKVEVLKRGKVRRAKLYYLRKYVGKKAKVKEKK